jgi:hypothetical protein
MTRTYKTSLLITGDAKGGVHAVRMTAKELEKLGTAGKKVGERLKAVGDNLKTAGRTLSTRVTVPITAAGVGILKAAGDFEAALNRVAAVSGASGDQFTALTEQAKELGRTTKFSASEAADAMGFLAMAGNDASEILAKEGRHIRRGLARGIGKTISSRSPYIGRKYACRSLPLALRPASIGVSSTASPRFLRTCWRCAS